MMKANSLLVKLRSRKQFISWDSLPERLRIKENGVVRQKEWHPVDCRFWEDTVDLNEVHSGGNPLVEIFDFIAKWEVYILWAYFGPSWQTAGNYFHADPQEAWRIRDMSTSATKNYRLSDFTYASLVKAPGNFVRNLGAHLSKRNRLGSSVCKR